MTHAPQNKKRVLVVDDDLGILEAMRFMLEASDFDVETVARGDEVVERVGAFKPHVVLLDLYLSGFDGRDIANDLKKREATRSVPIIMISAHPNAGESLKQTLIDDFLPKPFDVSQLLSCIGKYTSERP